MVAAVVVLVVVAAIIVFTGDDSEDGSGASWDSVAAFDRETGQVTILDRDGSEVDELDTGIVEPAFIFGEGNQLAIVADGEAAVVDVAAGTVEASDAPEGALASRLPASEPLVLAATAPEGGDATIVQATGSLDVAAEADLDDPLILQNAIRSNRTGTRFAAGDARSIQTAVVGTAQDDALLLDGLPLGLTDEIVVTTIAEGEAEVRFWSTEGDEISSAEVPSVHAAALLGEDGEVAVVSESGQVLLVGLGDDEAAEVATIDPPGDVLGVVSALGGRRLIVFAEQGIVVLDEGGGEVATVDFDGEWRRQLLVNNPAQRCVVVVAEDGAATMVDLESGETLGTADDVTFVNNWSLDGCTASLARPRDFTILREGGEVQLAEDETLAAVAPTGDQVVVRERSGQAWLRHLENDDADDVDLGDNPDTLYAFVDR